MSWSWMKTLFRSVQFTVIWLWVGRPTLIETLPSTRQSSDFSSIVSPEFELVTKQATSSFCRYCRTPEGHFSSLGTAVREARVGHSIYTPAQSPANRQASEAILLACDGCWLQFDASVIAVSSTYPFTITAVGAASQRDFDAFQQHNQRFHRMIVEASDNSVLLRLWDSLAFEVRTPFVLEYLTSVNPVLLAEEHKA